MEETLRKAGVKELPLGTPNESLDSHQHEIAKVEAPQNEGNNSFRDSKPKMTKAETEEKPTSVKPKKVVSFTADTKADKPASVTKQSVAAEKPVTPVMPTDESPEDAALRRQMIQYNMSEVGAVVAELDLDDETSSTAYSDDDDDKDMPDDSSLEEDDEDEHGRTKRVVLSDNYLAEMRDLEKKLNAKAIQNVGPNAPVTLFAQPTRDTRPANDRPANDTTKIPTLAKAKGVRFAPSLDIQSLPSSAPSISSPPTTSTTTKDPPPPTPSPPKTTLANQIVERPYTPSHSAPSLEPDEFDPDTLRQEVKTEYYKMRNRMIQRQGGFVDQDGADEEGRVPFTEEEGGPRKMSRFRAARLGKGVR